MKVTVDDVVQFECRHQLGTPATMIRSGGQRAPTARRALFDG
jgi:hypothetical protein